MIAQYKAARAVSAPLLAVETPDPQETGKTLMSYHPEYPAVRWDMIRGVVGMNDAGRSAATSALGQKRPENYGNLPLALELASQFPADTTLFALNAHMFLSNEGVRQAVCNVRDTFKLDGRCLVLLGPLFDLPAEIREDTVILTESLPTPVQLAQIVKRVYSDASVKEPTEGQLETFTDALLGLPAFPAEQASAMSLKRDEEGNLTQDGIDAKLLWERKQSTISSIPGLSFYTVKTTFDDLAGCANIKGFLGSLLNAPGRPRTVLFLDEIEKMVAGSGDTTGVSQALNEAFLGWTEDKQADGVILLGVPGAGKSATAKATAGTAGIPCMQLSLSGVKGSLVGQSEGNMRAALRAVDAISQGRVLMIATCNSIDALTPEIRARFRLGTFFYDLPDKEEQNALWSYYRERHERKDKAVHSPNWVGREIEACCKLSQRLQVPLEAASKYIVPIAASAGDTINNLRNQAAGRFISASYPGTYQIETSGDRAARQTR